MALGSEVVVIVSGGVVGIAALTEIDSDAVATRGEGSVESMACTEKLKVPAALAVPLIAPV